MVHSLSSREHRKKTAFDIKEQEFDVGDIDFEMPLRHPNLDFSTAAQDIIYPVKMDNLGDFNTFTELCNHPYYFLF